MRTKTYSFRFAEEVLNSKYKLKKELESIISDLQPSEENLPRPKLNALFKEKFEKKGWISQPNVFENKELGAKLDFLKERIGVEVAFSHPSVIGIDLLKFQTMSYSNLDKIDVGIYIVITHNFKKKLAEKGLKWIDSLTFEKVKNYLPHFRSAIQIPIFVIGLDD